jgi:hypothetical protein
MGSLPDGMLRAIERLPLWSWSLPVLLLLAVGLRMGIRLSRRILARRPARSRRIGASGARRALTVLRRDGWRVLATEVEREGVVEVDGRPEPFVVRADALVERDGRIWVAEVKGGDDSSSIRTRATRRQLLEYAHVFRTEGVLLVDARRRRVHVVRFPPLAAPVAGGVPVRSRSGVR